MTFSNGHAVFHQHGIQVCVRNLEILVPGFDGGAQHLKLLLEILNQLAGNLFGEMVLGVVAKSDLKRQRITQHLSNYVLDVEDDAFLVQ